MTQEKRWKIQELSTNGWTSIDPQSDRLTKEECDRWLNVLFNIGTVNTPSSFNLDSILLNHSLFM